MKQSVIDSLCDANFTNKKKFEKDFGIGEVEHNWREEFTLEDMEADHIEASVYPSGRGEEEEE